MNTYNDTTTKIRRLLMIARELLLGEGGCRSYDRALFDRIGVVDG